MRIAAIAVAGERELPDALAGVTKDPSLNNRVGW
jgi:hypothetical protein